ncbi:MAG: hypothetical protein H5T61_15370 [Thermoflexales bacterium]|nr:hypothetical protein [Thermoflexales bacterium]
MAECIVCKGEYTPGKNCPRCGTDNSSWESWQQNPVERGGLQGLEAFMRPHLYLPLIITIYTFGCSLIGLGGTWAGVRPGFQLLAVILTVCGCMVAIFANYEARHSIREQMLLAPLRRGWMAALNAPRTRALMLPALTILLAFLLVAGMAASHLLRELLCWLAFDPGYCKEDPSGFREQVTEALPLILMVCSCGFLISFAYSSSLLLAMRYAKEMNRALPMPLFLDDNHLAQVVRSAAAQVLDRTNGRVFRVIGAEMTSTSPEQTQRREERRYAGHWNWSDMERTPDGGIRMKAYVEEDCRQVETTSGLPQTQRTVAIYTVTADPWGRIRQIQRREEQQ